MPLSHHLTGWLLDAYPVHVGMAVWFLADDGLRHRLIDPYAPAFYVAGVRADSHERPASCNNVTSRTGPV